MSVIFPFSKVFVVILFMFWCNALLWMGNYYLLIFLFSSEFSWISKMEEFTWNYLHYPWTNVWPHVTFLGLYRIESLDSSSFTPRKALHGHGYETYVFHIHILKMCPILFSCELVLTLLRYHSWISGRWSSAREVFGRKQPFIQQKYWIKVFPWL